MTQELVDFVIEQTGRPLDRWAVAATLESGGIRDVDARERYGRRDVFDLADEVYDRCLQTGTPNGRPPEREVARRRRAAVIAGKYLTGGFFFIPLSLQLGSLLLLGYGQWAWLGFSERQASVVGIALLASLMLTGPFVQSLGYLGPYFAEPGRHGLVARITVALVGLGLGSLALGAAAWSLADVALGWYDRRTLAAGLVYFGLAGCVALTSAALYMLKHYLGMLLATAGGLAVVGVVLHGAGLGIYAAHWLGMGATIAIEAGWAAAVLARRSSRTSAELRAARLPPARVLAALVAPYAAYGAAYYVFFFVDRLAAWSAGADALPFTFRAEYEVGLDWALFSVVPALAMLEVTIYSFSQRLADAGRRYRARDAAQHNRALRDFYGRHLKLVALLLVAGSALVLAAGVLGSAGGLTKLDEHFTSRTTLQVYPLALAGYWLLVWALFSGLFLLFLGRPRLLLEALAPALAVAVIAAFGLSRTLPYWTAVVGLLAGAFVFAVLAARNALRVLREVDYYYFAAY
jgi:hypothetical protein